MPIKFPNLVSFQADLYWIGFGIVNIGDFLDKQPENFHQHQSVREISLTFDPTCEDYTSTFWDDLLFAILRLYPQLEELWLTPIGVWDDEYFYQIELTKQMYFGKEMLLLFSDEKTINEKTVDEKMAPFERVAKLLPKRTPRLKTRSMLERTKKVAVSCLQRILWFF